MNTKATEPVALPLDEEEAELIASYERGDYEDFDDPEELKRLLQAAKNTMKARKKQIGIRLDTADVSKIQQKAKYLGMPYQTLISSVLHQYAEGTLLQTDRGKTETLERECHPTDVSPEKANNQETKNAMSRSA